MISDMQFSVIELTVMFSGCVMVLISTLMPRRSWGTMLATAFGLAGLCAWSGPYLSTYLAEDLRIPFMAFFPAFGALIGMILDWGFGGQEDDEQWDAWEVFEDDA